MRINQAKRLNITPSLDEKIQLYNMTEDVLWADLDRYRPLKILDACVNCELSSYWDWGWVMGIERYLQSQEMTV